MNTFDLTFILNQISHIMYHNSIALPMRSFACVPHDVVGEMFFPCKGLAADFTSEWCVIIVCPHVVGQVLLAGILLAAQCTPVRCFPCMPQYMIHKMLFTGERFLAYVASVWCITYNILYSLCIKKFTYYIIIINHIYCNVSFPSSKEQCVNSRVGIANMKCNVKGEERVLCEPVHCPNEE